MKRLSALRWNRPIPFPRREFGSNPELLDFALDLIRPRIAMRGLFRIPSLVFAVVISCAAACTLLIAPALCPGSRRVGFSCAMLPFASARLPLYKGACGCVCARWGRVRIELRPSLHLKHDRLGRVGSEETRTLQDGAALSMVSFASSSSSPESAPALLSSPRRNIRSRTCGPSPLDLALPLPPLKRLPARAVSLPIAPLSLPSLTAIHTHTILHIADSLRAGIARLLPHMHRFRSAYAHRALFFEHNERNGDFVRGWMQVPPDRGLSTRGAIAQEGEDTLFRRRWIPFRCWLR